MNLKQGLTATTCVAVISDALLQPFFPQYFAAVFGLRRPEHVSLYLAATSCVVMLAFPLWAQLARGRNVLRILLATQLASALLCAACFAARSLASFVLLSLAMFALKASYLLIYPYVLRTQDPSRHHGTIGWLAFMLHFGSLSAALLGGALLDHLPARWLFLVMAAGDLMQCALVLAVRDPQLPGAEPEAAPLALAPLLRMGLPMFVVYFSAHLPDPFFTSYWQALGPRSSALQSGLVFGIPAAAALCAIALGERTHEARHDLGLPLASGVLGALLQLAPQLPLLLAGRALFGWALFVSMLRLDLLLFRLSASSHYAVDFSRIHLFQSSGALCASLAAGSLVGAHGLRAPLWGSGLGLALGCLLCTWLLPRRGLTVERTLP